MATVSAHMVTNIIHRTQQLAKILCTSQFAIHWPLGVLTWWLLVLQPLFIYLLLTYRLI